ncbi:MAG: Phosphoenolpyruvate synthase [Candidatus Magasanikbacteria bacterium GW2011_GWC2_37_14]|uniref:Phosphoenolpyruvate synthase n=1 Tax=Candidatus Magasanikbacteria bacterium GW2011_GWC2_37_14 TaxID=1619046 RepID=A0A0G0GPU9_9BACT|nr:MAG: Phosphoenolpyruvate synthase [Candidatus Magasanikbacteria bacterium GW2011_GWC2_37_14]
MKKEIFLAWTRDYTLAWAEWWSGQMNPRLMEVFGIGIPSQLYYFNGRLLETYRVVDEAKAFFKAVVNTDPKNGFFSENKINHYILLVKQIRELMGKINKNKDFANRAVFEKIKQLSREMYPWYTVSYLLPQAQWAPQLKEKYPKEANDILERLINARVKSEGAIQELVQYWRAVARILLSQRKLENKYASFVTFTEIQKMLDDNNYVPNKEELENRSTGYIFLGDKVYTNISKEVFFEKQDFYFSAPVNQFINQEIRGVVSCTGSTSIKGIVNIILKNDEIINFKEGNVLVTVMTNPFFIPIMKKAKAIITDEGGITCHAAIVARELNIPCITGTKISTKVLKDGDMVEVDAINGIIKKI